MLLNHKRTPTRGQTTAVAKEKVFGFPSWWETRIAGSYARTEKKKK